MSTRSIIGTAHDGGFTGRYCHWDGYPTVRGHQIFQAYAELNHDVEALKAYAIREGQVGYWSSFALPSEIESEASKPDHVTCDLCHGTGLRTDATGVSMGMHLKSGKGCNGCGKTGQMRNPHKVTTWEADNGDSWASDTNDWGAEWVYLLDDKGVTILTSRYDANAGETVGWRRETMVAWDSNPDWQAIEDQANGETIDAEVVDDVA